MKLDSPEVTLPPEHIGNLPAGFKRNEENLKRTDQLAEQLAAEAAVAGGINPDAFKEEREILTHFDPYSGQLKVTKPQPGRHYVWVIADKDGVMPAMYQGWGYQPVSGHDPECIHLKGMHRAAGSTLRGVGDVLLYWCPIEVHQQHEAHYAKKAAAMGAPEENWEAEANYGPVGRRYGPLAHGNPNDPLLRRTVFRGSNGQLARLTDSFKQGKPIPAGVQVRDEA